MAQTEVKESLGIKCLPSKYYGSEGNLCLISKDLGCDLAPKLQARKYSAFRMGARRRERPCAARMLDRMTWQNERFNQKVQHRTSQERNVKLPCVELKGNGTIALSHKIDSP
jgi:hypothetical protein